jgi:hypothetical protein
MLQYETGISHAAGDRRRLALVRDVTVAGTRWTVIRTMSTTPPGGYYSSNMTALPWRVSFEPLERFRIFQVESE